MKRLFCLFSIVFFLGLTLTAQDIPVKKEDKNSYSFEVPTFITVQDFEFVSAVTTDNPDIYIINIRALNTDKKTDERVNGGLLFEINGKMLPVLFTNGAGKVEAEIKGTDKITMKAVDTNVTRTGKINHPFPWEKIAGLAVAVVVLGLVIWFVQKRKKR